MQTGEEAMSKEQLLQEFAEAFEKLIGTASLAAQRGVTRQGDRWGPREIVAGMPPLEFADETQQTVMNDAINATMVTMIGEQPLETVCGILRQAYQQDVEILRKLDDTFFQPGEYVYERTKAVIEHCQEHSQELVLNYS